MPLAVWLEDRGPVFFAQTARREEPRAIPDLQVPHHAAERRASGDLYTQPTTPRITRVGRFLRASPARRIAAALERAAGRHEPDRARGPNGTELVERYEREIPCYHFRHLVKPGITGWAQVNYPYGANIEDTAAQARIRPLLHPPFLVHPRCLHRPEDDPRHARREGR